MGKSLSKQREDVWLQFEKYVSSSKREQKVGVFLPLQFAERLLRVFSPHNETKKR